MSFPHRTDQAAFKKGKGKTVFGLMHLNSERLESLLKTGPGLAQGGGHGLVNLRVFAVTGNALVNLENGKRKGRASKTVRCSNGSNEKVFRPRWTTAIGFNILGAGSF